MLSPLPLSLIAIALGLAGGFFGVMAWRRQRALEQRLVAFFAGKDGQSLEPLLHEQGALLTAHAKELQDLLKASEYLHHAIQTSLRKVAFERYNPFPGVGGNQSFTLVLLDAFNTGVVLSSLHNRESTRVYAKAIRQGKALQNLSEEEERVFKNALLMKGA